METSQTKQTTLSLNWPNVLHGLCVLCSLNDLDVFMIMTHVDAISLPILYL